MNKKAYLIWLFAIIFWCTFLIQQVNAENEESKWDSSKASKTNNLEISLWDDSPIKNERQTLIINTDEKYTWKITFPKLQYYSWDAEKWIDISLTSENFISDYSDEISLWYINLKSSDSWKKELPQFIKFSKNWYYRIYAEDEDWEDIYTEFKVSSKSSQTSTQTNNTTGTNNIQTNSSTNWSNLDEYSSNSSSKYISRSCKPYNIEFISSLNAYTSPDLNKKEYFVNIDYFKRYVDSKNAQNAECYTERTRISSPYIDNENRTDRYIAPNWKIYFIIQENWLYTSNELSSQKWFSTNDELKEYIKNRNQLISMISYSKSPVTPREFWEPVKTTLNYTNDGQTSTKNNSDIDIKDDESLDIIRNELLSD